MQTLDANQVRTLLGVAKGDRLEALYVLAVTTGMRQGELLGLRWRDVNLDRRRVAVRGNLQREGSGMTIAEPKTPRSRRQIHLSEIARDALLQHQFRQQGERRLAANLWDGSLGLVFSNQVGRPIEATNMIRRSFHPMLAGAGLPRIRFHDLRHTAATLLLSSGVHPKIASEMLGHSSVAFTLDVYSHVTETLQREAALAMDAALRPLTDPDSVGVKMGVKPENDPTEESPKTLNLNTKTKCASQDSNLGPWGYEPPALTG